MAIPVVIPNTFANATVSIPLSQLDTNFSTLANVFSDIDDGSQTLANLQATSINVTGLYATTINTVNTSNVVYIQNGNVRLEALATSVGNNLANTTNLSTTDGTVAIGRDNLSLSNNTGDYNVAIGTANGYSNTSGSHNALIGYNNLYYGTNSANNVAIGYRVMFQRSGSKQQNVGIGYNACNNLDVATGNIGIGTAALADLLSYNYNVAIGQNAFTNSTGGEYNIGIGYLVGYSSTTGGDNVLIGRRAGYSSTTGYNNVAIGKEALFGLTLATNVIAIGYGAASNATYNSNYSVNSIFIGYEAGFSAIGSAGLGTNSIAIGGRALYQNGSKNNNVTALGLEAGYYNDGDNNTFLGYRANYNIASPFTGSNCTLLGANSVPLTSASTNEITLGDPSITLLRCNVTTITALSDERDKNNVVPLKNTKDFILALNPVSFTWNQRDGGRVGIDDHGFIAQQLLAAQEEANYTVPDLVNQSNPDRLEAAYGKLMPSIVSALQDALKEIDELKKEIALLKGV